MSFLMHDKRKLYKIYIAKYFKYCITWWKRVS